MGDENQMTLAVAYQDGRFLHWRRFRLAEDARFDISMILHPRDRVRKTRFRIKDDRICLGYIVIGQASFPRYIEVLGETAERHWYANLKSALEQRGAVQVLSVALISHGSFDCYAVAIAEVPFLDPTHLKSVLLFEPRSGPPVSLVYFELRLALGARSRHYRGQRNDERADRPKARLLVTTCHAPGLSPRVQERAKAKRARLALIRDSSRSGKGRPVRLAAARSGQAACE